MPVVHNTFRDRNQPRPDRRAMRVARLHTTESPSPAWGLGTTADPYQTNSAQVVASVREPNLVYGHIAEVIEYARTYRVKLERGGGLILCCDLMHTSFETMGASQLNTYVPGSAVIVLWHPHAHYGIILGCIPDWMVAGRDAMSDYISQGSNVGLAVDQVHSFPLQLEDNGGVVDWSAGRPFDNIADGDWGAVTDTGGMVFLDPFMTFMRVDEETGIFFFYDNQRGRLAAHNLQIRSAQHETESFEDQSEANFWEGHTTGMYCERMGRFSEGNRSRTYSAEQFQLTLPWYTRFEPTSDEQQAIFRLRIFRGYFGQGDSRMLCIPPPNASGIQKYSEKRLFPGVAEDQWSTDGMISIRSAKALIIAKRAILPNPKQLKLPEDVTGDIDNCLVKNYRFRGKVNCPIVPPPNPPDHQVGDMLDATIKKSLVRAAAFRDLYALKEMHKDLLGLRYHYKDWYVPNEGDYPFSGQMATGILDYSVLCGQQWLEPPLPIHLKVDDRYNFGLATVNYWPNDSYLAMLEDGGLLLADGFGFELRTIDGSAIMSTPGDIWMLPGRSFHCWAGWDITARGNNCVDIASNKCDVRIKANNNVLIFGGNDICGGVLIESKSPAIDFRCLTDSEILGGVIIRAKHSAVVTYAAQIEMILSGEGMEVPGHPPAIVMSAHNGVILTESDHFFRHIHKSAQDVFVDDDCVVCGVNEYWCTSTLFETPVRVKGDVFIDGCLAVTNNITSGAHISGFFVDVIYDNSSFLDMASQLTTRISELHAWGGLSCTDTQRLENDTDVTKLEFYWRTTEQQKMEDLVLFETKWQQEARVKGMPVQKWTENPLVCEDCFVGKPQHFYPPPGKKAWVDDADWYNENQKLFSIPNNLMSDWGGVYEYPTPSYEDPTNQKFDTNFLIIRNTCVGCN